MSTVAEQVERVLKPIQQFTRGWMLSAMPRARAAALGIDDAEDFWILGRAGVLGDVGPDVAAAGLGFLAPSRVRAAWAAIPAGSSPSSLATEYADMCRSWGTEALASFDRARMERLDELGRKLADAADGSIGTVFAGTRALPQSDELGARVALTMHVLRELRGAAHLVAVHASGLSPLQAILASPAPPPRSGPEWAGHLGWTGPFEATTDEMRAARAEAERLTSRLLLPVYASLGATELEEFAELVETTRNAIDM